MKLGGLIALEHKVLYFSPNRCNMNKNNAYLHTTIYFPLENIFLSPKSVKNYFQAHYIIKYDSEQISAWTVWQERGKIFQILLSGHLQYVSMTSGIYKNTVLETET